MIAGRLVRRLSINLDEGVHAYEEIVLDAGTAVRCAIVGESQKASRALVAAVPASAGIPAYNRVHQEAVTTDFAKPGQPAVLYLPEPGTYTIVGWGISPAYMAMTQEERDRNPPELTVTTAIVEVGATPDVEVSLSF